MIVIKPIEERIIRQLAHYKFLTVSQLERLKVGQANWIRAGLRNLAKNGFTKNAQYGAVTRKAGHAEKIHYLTIKGAKTLAEIDRKTIESVRFPKSTNSIFKNDYFHRISTLNTRIAFDFWANEKNLKTILFQTYFDKVGSQIRKEKDNFLKSATRLDYPHTDKFITPDAIIIYQSHTGQKHLFILEVFNGNDTKRVVEQLKKIIDYIIEGVPTDKYKLDVDCKILCTFEHESNLKAVIKRINEDERFYYDGIEDYFYFKVASQVIDSFGFNWLTIKNQVTELPF